MTLYIFLKLCKCSLIYFFFYLKLIVLFINKNHSIFQAVNEAGQGPNSETVTCKTPASRPGVISNINVNALSNAIYLSWSEPPSNGSEILSYNIELDDCVYNTEENVLELYLEDLSPETQYRYSFFLAC